MVAPVEPNTIPGPVGYQFSGSGIVDEALNAAMDMLGTPYVWGGSDANGVDCSGLIYYALNSAGYPTARYRAVDYGHMGQAVSEDQARPGDIVYFDNAGDVDHVGLYLGDGKYIEAPTQGQRVQISSLNGRQPTSIRRILPDSAWSGMPITASGKIYYRYGDTAYHGGLGNQTPSVEDYASAIDQFDQTYQQSKQPALADQPIADVVENPVTKAKQSGELPSG